MILYIYILSADPVDPREALLVLQSATLSDLNLNIFRQMPEVDRSSVTIHHVNHFSRSSGPDWPSNDKSILGRIHLVLHSRLATTLSDPSLKYLPTNARGWTDHLLRSTMLTTWAEV